MNSTLKRKIKHAQVVSFDVFDTLLKRNCGKGKQGLKYEYF